MFPFRVAFHLNLLLNTRMTFMCAMHERKSIIDNEYMPIDERSSWIRG